MDTLVAVSDGIWNPMAYFALVVGLFFTVLTVGVQFRRLPDTLRQITERKTSDEGISPLQALLLTLSSRVGVGNIAGVATALGAGGPGALVWMALCALLGSAAAFAETVLAQVYKRAVGGEHRGGIPFYVEHGLKLKWLAVVLAVVTFAGYGFVFPGVQSNNIATSVEGAFGVPSWATAVVITGLLAFVIVGGTKRIVRAAQVMVPVMAVGYIVTAIVVLAVNYDRIIPAVGVILGSAVGADKVFGGIAGAAVAWGVRRAVFSNVAGVGEGTFGAAASAVSHPVKQGLVQSFSIFVDTLLVCMATGVMIVVTGAYNVTDADGSPLVTNVPGLSAGPEYTQRAVDSVATGVGPGFVAIALFFFAFTTLIAFFYIASTNLVYLLGGRAARWPGHALKAGMLAITFYGAVESADVIWTIGDIGYGSLAWLNMICLLALSPVVRKLVRDYDAQRRRGLDPRFDPVPLGITGADFWHTSRLREDSKKPT